MKSVLTSHLAPICGVRNDDGADDDYDTTFAFTLAVIAGLSTVFGAL